MTLNFKAAVTKTEILRRTTADELGTNLDKPKEPSGTDPKFEYELEDGRWWLY